MYKVILILDKFFLKYEGGSIWPPQKKLPSKGPALLGLNNKAVNSEAVIKNLLDTSTDKKTAYEGVHF